MPDTPTQDGKRLVYHEAREYAVIEEALRNRAYDLAKWVALSIATLAIALALFHLFVAVFGTPESRAFRSTHLTVMMVLAVLIYPLGRKNWREAPVGPLGWSAFAVDLVLITVVFGIQVYTLWDITAFTMRVGELTQADVLVGATMIALVLETTRRAVGIPMVLVTLFFIAHSLYADHFFGFFYGPPTSFTRYIDLVFMRTEGIFGIPISVAATYIVLFIMFGAILIRTGAGRLFIDLAVAITGHRAGGPAKAAVVSSAMLGTVSGSAVANVVTTGSFTIPLMKRLGYKPKFAGGVEACASSGGQITPPIMGAAAFIIAEFMHVSYFEVVVAAIIPTLLYFTTIYFMVDVEADKLGLRRLDRSELPRVWDIVKQGWHQIFTLVVLVGLMGVGYSPMMAAFWSILTLVALSFRESVTRLSPIDLFAALETGVRSAMPVTIACACAGIIVGSIFVSGLGLKFTNGVIMMSGGHLILLLALTGVAAIILGMGMTTTAVYITVAALIVPSLIQLNVEPMAAHLFAFYYGVVSSITPPVALAAFAGAAIAGSKPMETAVEASRIGIAKFLAPFLFVYSPALIFVGPLWMTLVCSVFAFVGLWGLTLLLEGWYKGPLSHITRLALGALSIMALMPPEVQRFEGVPPFVVPIIGFAGIVLFTTTRQRFKPEMAR